MNSVTLPMHRQLQGGRLGLVWLGCVAVSWVVAYAFARLVIWVAHEIGALLP